MFDADLFKFGRGIPSTHADLSRDKRLRGVGKLQISLYAEPWTVVTEKLPQMVGDRAKSAGPIEINHPMPRWRRAGEFGASFDMRKERRIRNHANSVRVPFTTHQEYTLGQGRQQIA